MRRLPPLTAIEAFVYVARTGSVKAAAEILSLSSPALSRRLQALERHLGRPLFDRRHQGVSLNADGERLLGEIGPPLDQLSRAIERAVGDEEVMRLHISVPSLFASQRLMPALPELRLKHPNLHIDIDTGARRLARLDEGLDAAIVIASEIPSNFYSRRLYSNRVVAIVSRELAENGEHPIAKPADLSRHTIFLHRDLPRAFHYWRDAIGVPDLQPRAMDMFDAGQLVLDAAAQGLGIAFMLENHLSGARNPGLMNLFDVAAESPYSYWFACRRASLSRRPVRILHDWLVRLWAEDAKASAKPPAGAAQSAA